MLMFPDSADRPSDRRSAHGSEHHAFHDCQLEAEQPSRWLEPPDATEQKDPLRGHLVQADEQAEANGAPRDEVRASRPVETLWPASLASWHCARGEAQSRR